MENEKDPFSEYNPKPFSVPDGYFESSREGLLAIPDSASAETQRPWWRWSVAATVAVLLAASAYWFTRQPTAEQYTDRTEMETLLYTDFDVYDLAAQLPDSALSNQPALLLEDEITKEQIEAYLMQQGISDDDVYLLLTQEL